jgi:Cft2 family RNA processing exonuclease
MFRNFLGMSEESITQKITDSVKKFATEHPYATITTASAVVSLFGQYLWKKWDNLRSKNTIIELDFTNLTILTVII